MDLGKQTKLALEETRTEILGAQILLGFQFRSAFEPGFDLMPALVRYLNLTALALMLITVGLLILPGPYHRIAECGEDSGSLIRLTSGVAAIALAPFGIAVGVDMAIASLRIWGAVVAATAGVAATLVAAFFWYVWEFRTMNIRGEKERQASKRHGDAREDPGLHAKIDAMLTEARVVLPGVQALLGFQLAIVFTDAFEKIAPASKYVHGAALALTTLAIILLIAPAAYHRLVYAGEESLEFHRIGSVLVTASTVPLAMALSADVYVVAEKVLNSTSGAITASVACFVFLTACWHALPLISRDRIWRASPPSRG